jgi:tRNA-splicing ligase RtcB
MEEQLNKLSFKVNVEKHSKQLGTLGGGNHFIEIVQQQDEPRNKYMIIHSGSRNLGTLIAEHHQKIAKSNFEIKKEFPSKEELSLIPNEQKQQYIAN